jgi:tellurite resistance-related uncharacterized protein
MERLNRAVALAAIPALVAVIVIDVRTIAGHDSVSGKLEDDIVWWLITGITVVVVTTLQVSARFYVAKYQNGWRWLPGSRGWMPNLLNFKRMPVWCKSIAYAVLAISIALTLYAWLGQPSNVQGDVRFLPTGVAVPASPEEVFREHATAVASTSAGFIQLLIYPVLFLLSGTSFTAVNSPPPLTPE